jgi:hypothetical protein
MVKICSKVFKPFGFQNSQIDVVLHQTHSGVARPALLVVVANDVLVVGIGMLSQISLDQVTSFISSESMEKVFCQKSLT